MERKYYQKIQIINHLENLSRTDGPIDWLRQEEFFKKIKDFAGEMIATAIIDDILGRIGTPNKISDREYINKFLKLLAQKNNINNKNNNNIIINDNISPLLEEDDNNRITTTSSNFSDF